MKMDKKFIGELMMDLTGHTRMTNKLEKQLFDFRIDWETKGDRLLFVNNMTNRRHTYWF